MGYMFFLALVFLLPLDAAVHEAPVTEFWGQDIVILDPTKSVTLQWYILPGNATVYWIRCYSGKVANASTHFYTYNYNTEEYWQGGVLTNRSIIHSVHYRAHRPIVFSLILGSPVEEDSDLYFCELEGWGMAEPQTASLRLRVFLQPTHHAIMEDENSTEPTHDMTEGTRDTFDYDVNLTTPTITYTFIEGDNLQNHWVIFVGVMSSIMFIIGCAVIWKLIMAGSFPVSRLFQRKGDRRNGTVQHKASVEDGNTDEMERLESQDKLLDI